MSAGLSVLRAAPWGVSVRLSVYPCIPWRRPQRRPQPRGGAARRAAMLRGRCGSLRAPCRGGGGSEPGRSASPGSAARPASRHRPGHGPAPRRPSTPSPGRRGARAAAGAALPPARPGTAPAAGAPANQRGAVRASAPAAPRGRPRARPLSQTGTGDRIIIMGTVCFSRRCCLLFALAWASRLAGGSGGAGKKRGLRRRAAFPRRGRRGAAAPGEPCLSALLCPL